MTWNSYIIDRYTYCLNNPLRYTDPSGMLWGEFIRDGIVIGNDGIDDGKIYVLRDKDLTSKVMRETAKFIKLNSGNTEAFMNNRMAYENSIEIVGSQATRQTMFNHVSLDDGNGGTRPENNQEHGGYLDNGVAIQVPSGPVTTPGNTASIRLPMGYDKYHSHPSGTLGGGIDINANFNTIGSGTPVKSFDQFPSPDSDIPNIGRNTGYIFGRGDKTVYIYNKNGVQATMRTEDWLRLRR